ncbi:MAG: isocitrate lyase/phosphoenolpyruvate mutase family protein [Hyphomonadaceae bacterium]|nr:isocitrate lyase/phosphoenolpyruvate mutase family protein [Hyphomonadaceae bacterium]
MLDQKKAASAFAELHRDFLILPNVWDAASAKVVEHVGARAVATSSAAVAWAHGYCDGHDLPISKLIATIAEIARVVDLPITCDAEGGYADAPADVAENVRALIGAGAVGINLEDGHTPHASHLRKIEAVREAAEAEGVDLYINARTDVYLKNLAPPGKALEEVVLRGQACREAGASGLFAPFLSKPEEIAVLVAAVALPLNLMAWPGLPNAAALKALGVKRLSAATWVFRAATHALAGAARGFLIDGDSDALALCAGERIDFDALMKG